MTNVRVEQGQLAVALNPPQGGGLTRSSFLYLNDNGRVDYQPVARFSADPGEHLRIQGINDPSDGDYLRKFDFSGLLPYPVLGWDIRGRSGEELDVFAVYNQTIPAYEGAAEETPFYLFTAHASGASVRNQATVVANSVINAAESQDLSKGTIMTLSAFATAGNDSGSESVIGMDNSTINFGDDSNSLMFLGGANREKEGPNNNTYGFTAMRDSVVNMGGGDDSIDVSAASNLVDKESFFTFKGGLFQGKNTINGGAGFDVVEIHKPVDGFELTMQSGRLKQLVEKETGALVVFSGVEQVRFFGGTYDTDEIIGLDPPSQNVPDVEDQVAVTPIKDSELIGLDLLDLLEKFELSQEDILRLQEIFKQGSQSLPDAVRRFLADAGVPQDEISQIFDNVDTAIDYLLKPDSFKKKNAIRFDDFDPSVDQARISLESFGLVPSDAWIGFAKNPRQARKKVSSREFNFIYEDKKGGLYFNENGADKGFGDGGLIAIIKGSPALDESSFTLI